MESKSSNPVPEQTFSTIVNEHLALTLSIALFLFVVARVLFVARLNIATGLAVVATSGAVDVALGIVVASYSTVVVLAYLGVDAWRRYKAGKGQSTAVQAAVQTNLAFALIFLLPWISAVFYLAIIGAFGYRGNRWGAKKSEPARAYASGGAMAWALVYSVFVAGSAVWLPAEVLVVQDSVTPLVGYVLADDAGWATVLQEDDRSVVRIRAASITERILCLPAKQSVGSSLAASVLGGSDAVLCEDVVRNLRDDSN